MLVDLLIAGQRSSNGQADFAESQMTVSSSFIDQGQQSSGAAAAPPPPLEEGDDSLITEILTIIPVTLLDTSVSCLISWAGDGIDRGHYIPGLVRIGPLHRQDPSQRSADWVEQVKKDVLRGLLMSHDEAGRREELRSYLEAMEGMEADARRCYNRTFSLMTSKEFARMLLLDGCFLYSRFVSCSVDDITVDRDIIFLLENQIPFFVLEEIHRLLIARGRPDVSVVVLDKVASRVEQVLRCNGYSSTTLDHTSSPPPCHLLHLLYMYFIPAGAGTGSGTVQVPVCWRTVTHCFSTSVMLLKRMLGVGHTNNTSSSSNNTNSNSSNNTNTTSSGVPAPQVHWRTATQYYAAGVRLVKRKLGNGEGEARSILDVEVRGETLHAPCLTVDNNTFRMLRNMVALEQKSLQQRTSHVTAYCLFMSQLASTEKDVELLITKGIIVHLLHSNKDVATGLAGLCDGVVLNAYDPDLCYLRHQQEALEKLCRSSWRKSKAWLRHIKCDNRLKMLAVVAAVVIFIATLLQLLFAGLGYGNGKGH